MPAGQVLCLQEKTRVYVGEILMTCRCVHYMGYMKDTRLTRGPNVV